MTSPRPHPNDDPLQTATRRLRDFVIQSALPLWASSGFDEENGSFQERLDFCGKPTQSQPRRLMVQCRQIVVYARASILALQLLFLKASESMGNHDSEVVGACSVD